MPGPGIRLEFLKIRSALKGTTRAAQPTQPMGFHPPGKLSARLALLRLFARDYPGNAGSRPGWLKPEELTGVGMSDLHPVSVADRTMIQPELGLNDVLIGVVDR